MDSDTLLDILLKRLGDEIAQLFDMYLLSAFPSEGTYGEELDRLAAEYEGMDAIPSPLIPSFLIFQTDMLNKLTKFAVAAHVLGSMNRGDTWGSGLPINNLTNDVAQNISTQGDYLNGFMNAMIAKYREMTKEQFRGEFGTRAKQYTDSIIKPYWQGLTEVLPLPALPGDGTSQCLTHCRCKWRIDVLDRGVGDYDCFWELQPAEHCQTCLERAKEWSPLRIRNFEVQIP